MRKFSRVLAVVVFLGALLTASFVWADRGTGNSSKIQVEIDYGSLRPSRAVEATWKEGRTALAVLQSVATVETHPVGSYVFVTSIDGVSAKRGETAWYYTLNDKPTGELAYTKVPAAGERVKWVHKKDVCSWKVDGTPKP